MPPAQSSGKPPHHAPARPRSAWRIVLIVTGIVLALALIALSLAAYGLSVAYQHLPALESLTDYRPKIPLRVYTVDNVLIGEFGDERRDPMRIKDIPDVMKKAVLAIEDDRFYTHGGVDFMGILRAALHNASGGAKQGASTITQQVARNFFLSNEQTLKRKTYEVLLAWKIEQNLSKDQILEVYMNQIFLGQRAYGFSSAAQIYFGKNLKDVTVAEAAMLAGLPKAPSAYNPIVNPKRAATRQQYIIQRMRQLNYITEAQYTQAMAEPLKLKQVMNTFEVHAEYVAEMARQMMYDQFKDETYTRGLKVFTTVTKSDQDAAYQALRHGVMDYEKRHGYRGPEGYLDIPTTKEAAAAAVGTALASHPDSDDLVSAIVVSATPTQVQVVTSAGEEVTVTGAGLAFGGGALSAKDPNRRIQRGSIVRVERAGASWSLSQMPEVQSAFVAASTTDGAIRAMVGGFDFNRNKFNHVTQAWRQPGSSFKPFIYSASLEKGLSPATIIDDSPITFAGSQTGGDAWSPKNYDNKYEGPMTMRQGLMKSKNMISIRILQKIGAKYGQEHAARFGFDPDKNLPYLTLALGSGAVTPLQMAGAYAVFANGGYKVTPYLIAKVTDNNGNVLAQSKPDTAGNEAVRVIDERNAFLINSMLQDVVKHGTAIKAMSLKRLDLAGKTGTTNDSIDAWFAGYQPKLVGVAWIGYDQPKNLGNRETGGGLALPIWVSFMEKALKGVPNEERAVPPGMVQVGGEYYYAERPPGRGVGRLSPEEETPAEEVVLEITKSVPVPTEDPPKPEATEQ
jgi:penicillin-binding protein 1A